MKIPLLDLTREHAAIRDEVRQAWTGVLDAMHLLKGEHVRRFEAEFAAYVGTAQAVGVASGTDALITTIRALSIGPGDEVIVQANAFVAAIEAVFLAGATPVVVDVEADGFGPDPAAVEAAVGARTKAVLAVHLYGAPLDLDRIAALCRQRELSLVEDASHAHGASRAGRKVGSIGVAGCFSCGVVKNLAAYGDAGVVTTNDAGLAESIRLLGTHGQQKKNHHVSYGFNSRLDELQAAALRIKLQHLDRRNRRRAEIAAYYRQRFAAIDVRCPLERDGEVHVYHQFVLRTAQRQGLAAHLAAAGVDSGIHYPVPLHRQPAFLRFYGESPALPRSERLAQEILSIPVFPDLADAEVEFVADSVVSFFRP